MVTAGVYMMARSAPLFELAPQTKLIVCGIGAVDMATPQPVHQALDVFDRVLEEMEQLSQ
jgi:hypothetical protein